MLKLDIFQFTGVNPREKGSLIDQVKSINEKGKSHPLWRWVCEEKI